MERLFQNEPEVPKIAHLANAMVRMRTKPLRRVKAISIGLIALFFLSILSGSFNYVSAQSSNEKQANADSITSIVEKAQGHLTFIFAKLESSGVTIPEDAKTSFDKGQLKADQAKLALSSSKIDEVYEDAISAMSYFEKAIRQIKDLNETTLSTETATLEDTADRTRIFVERLENITRDMGQKGYDTTNMTEKIVQARTILIDVGKLTDIGDLETAAKNLGEIQRTTVKLRGDLDRVATNEKSRKINDFTDESIERITEIEHRADLLLPQASIEVKNSTENAKEHITQSRNLLDENNLDRSIDELEKMSDEAEKGDSRFWKEIPHSGDNLNVIVTDLTSRLDDLSKTLEGLKVAKNANEAKAKFADATILLTKANDAIKLGNFEDAAKDVKTIESLVHSIEELIKHSSNSPDSSDESPTSADSRTETITDQKSRLNDLSKTLDGLKTAKNINEAKTKLAEATTLLTKANDAIKLENFKTADENIKGIESLIHSIEDIINSSDN